MTGVQTCALPISQLHRIQLRRAFFVPWAEVDLEISGQPVVIVVDYLSRRCVAQRRNGRSSLVIIISTVIRLREELITEHRVDVVFIVNVFPAKVFLMRGMFYHIDGNLGGDTIEEQAEWSCKNVGEILKAAGTDYEHVLKTTDRKSVV